MKYIHSYATAGDVLPLLRRIDEDQPLKNIRTGKRRAGIETLDLDGVAMVCIAYLEVKGSPSHLRYLLQRLRERLPRQKLLVGLWPAGEAVLATKRCATRSARIIT